MIPIESTDELSAAYDEFAKVFKSLKAFTKYYNSDLINKDVKLWGKELETQIYRVHDYLKKIGIGIVTSDMVNYGVNRVKMWKENTDGFAFRIKDDLERREAEGDIPEAIYGIEQIEADEKRLGKPYAELESNYLKQIQNEIVFLRDIKPFCEESFNAFNMAYVEMKRVFRPYLLQEDTKKVVIRGDQSITDDKEWPSNDTGKKGEKGRRNKENKVSEIPPFKLLTNFAGNVKGLCDYLIKNNAIKEIGVIDFRKIFEGKPISVRIYWLKGMKDLRAFIDLIADQNNPLINPCDKWKITMAYFNDGDRPVNYGSVKSSKYAKEAIPSYIAEAVNILRGKRK